MNVLLVVVDTERADHVSCYGYPRRTTPNADAPASHGVLFRHADVQASFSQGSYASLFTGLHPQTPGVRDHISTLAPECTTIAETLANAGYRTAGFHNHPLLLTQYGYGQGMTTYEDTRTATDTVTRALDWIGAQGDAPWFLFVQFMEPHAPYEPPPPFDEKFATRPPGFLEGTNWKPGQGYPQEWMFDFESQHLRPEDVEYLKAAYDGEIAYVDDQIGRLVAGLDKTGRCDGTLVIYTADHGEAFGEHKVWFNHDATVYEEILHVPLILSNPKLFPERKDVAEVAREIDVYPTVMDLLALPPGRVEGETLLPLIDGQQPRRLAFAESRPLEPSRAGLKNYRTSVPGIAGKWRSERHGDMKLIRIPGPSNNAEELYDLGADPGEQHDRSLDRGEEKSEMSRTLSRFVSRAPFIPDRRTTVTPATAATLRAIGYLGDSQPPPPPLLEKPIPK
ncbi:MAG: sulfatase [Planctomycetes bacterium]|nr:sulfatase [Planctomycetota bacterium]